MKDGRWTKELAYQLERLNIFILKFIRTNGHTWGWTRIENGGGSIGNKNRTRGEEMKKKSYKVLDSTQSQG